MRIIAALILVVVVVVALRLRRFSGARSGARATPRIPGGGGNLRDQVLSRRVFADMPPVGADVVRCVVMDWNLGGAKLATLVAFDDGTTSLYLSSGGGVIGAGAHEAVRGAAARFREQAVAERGRFAPVIAHDRPGADMTVFYLVTERATLSSGPVPNAELQEGTHPLAALAAHAQQVIGEVRRVSAVPH